MLGFVVDKVALGQIVFSKSFSFPLSVSFHNCSVIILHLLVAVSIMTNGRSWENLKSLFLSEKEERWVYEVTSLRQWIPTFRRKVMLPSSKVKILNRRHLGVGEYK